MEITRLPALTQIDCMMYIDWNEQIHPDENNLRVGRMLQYVNTKTIQENRFIGQQQFLINQGTDMGFSEAEIYLAYASEDEMLRGSKELSQYMSQHFPIASFRIYPPNTRSI